MFFQSKGLDTKYGFVTVSDRPDLAHFQCNGALASAKSLKRNPRELAQEVLSAVQAEGDARFGAGALKLSIAGPGFINVILGDDVLAKLIQGQTLDDRLGIAPLEKPVTVVVDYGGPNVAKGMHVGHLRSSIIGDSIVRINRFFGNKVIGDNHVGDWGTQMGMLICELKLRKPELAYFDSNFTEIANEKISGDLS